MTSEKVRVARIGAAHGIRGEVRLWPFTQNPIYGANPKKWFTLALRSKHMDPADVMYTP
jgi:ribosomal 30S subunit maturation factor RimM